MNASIQITPRGHAVLDHLRRLGGIERGRLLAQDVLSGIGRTRRPLLVEMVRERDVDRVDVVGGEQLLV
jgi:hypothetical protein